jgi:hypothetical protein
MNRILVNTSGGRTRPGFQKTRLIQFDDCPHTYGTSGQYLGINPDSSGFILITPPPFSRGGSLYIPGGIADAVNLAVWVAPFACTVLAVKGYRIGGTGAEINAQLNGASPHLNTALSLTDAGVWIDGGAVQNAAYAIGDSLEIMIVSVADGPTQVAVQVDFERIYS